MSAEDNKRLIRRLIEEGWNGKDEAVIDELVSPDGVGTVAGDPEKRKGPAGMKKGLKMARDAAGDFRVTIDDMIAEGDRVAVRWTATADVQKEVPGLGRQKQKPGKLTVTGNDFYRIQRGKIVEGHRQWDAMKVLKHVGALDG